MASPDSQAGLDAAGLLLRCHKMEKSLAAFAGLSVDEFHCLIQLRLHAPCCVKTLCELTGIHATRASKLLSALEKRGYLVRSLGVEDKRKESLTLTNAGAGVARSLLESCALAGRDILGLVGGQEVQNSGDALNEDYPSVRM